MKKSTLIAAGVIIGAVVLIGAAGVVRRSASVESVLPVAADAKNMSYTIGSETFVLADGRAEKEIVPGSASKDLILMFGEPVYGDLDADGDSDAAVMLINESGGSGVFFYAVLALKTDTGYVATNALLLGDRIAPQTVEIHDGRAVFNYAQRRADEPMTARPSMGKSLWIHLNKATGNIGEWVKDFEGEADTARMTLPMKKWVWVSAKTADGKILTPKKADAFTLTFGTDLRVAVGTDCNRGGGSYVAQSGTLTFGSLMSTKMYCDGSQEMEFSALLQDVAKYRFTGNGELVLTLKTAPGEMVFR
jgi:heat shock protein HslJ